MYEFIHGVPPFGDTNVDTIFSNIINTGIRYSYRLLIRIDPVFDIDVDRYTRDLITRMLKKDPNHRIPIEGKTSATIAV